MLPKIVYILLMISSIHSDEVRQNRRKYDFKSLSGDVKHLFQREGSKSLPYFYQKAVDKLRLRFVKFDAIQEIKQYVDRVNKMLDHMNRSLHNVISWMEEEVAKYPRNTNLTVSDVVYSNLRELDPNDEHLTRSSQYAFPVLAGQSAIHVPVEVYTGAADVFHTIKWSKAMDRIVAKNRGLHFTYFASKSGIFRVFPAFPWDKKEVDLFDIRQTPWYNQGATIPKDLLILIDTSGSMTGLSLKIANVSAQRMISNLDENDYFVVTHFHEVDKKGPLTLTTLNQSLCFESFVRATKRNKNRVFKELSTLTAKGYAQFDQSLKEAINMFEQLNNITRSDRTASQCNQILVVLTDDAFTFDQKIIEVLKNKPANIKVLVYSVGDPVNIEDTYERGICRHQGHYRYFPSTGVVSNLMKDYMEQSTVIARGSDKGPIKTDVILHGANDLFQTAEYNGTGLMISLSKPVYNRTDNYQFMGLMGTDIPVERLIAKLPVEKFGPLGYAFALNPTGNVAFHPGLKRFIDYSADTPLLDILDLEFDTSGSKEKIRRQMIDNLDGQQIVRDFIKVYDQVHTYEASRKYIYTRLPQTDFGLAFVIPEDQYEYLWIEESDSSLASLLQYNLDRIDATKFANIRMFFSAIHERESHADIAEPDFSTETTTEEFSTNPTTTTETSTSTVIHTSTTAASVRQQTTPSSNENNFFGDWDFLPFGETRDKRDTLYAFNASEEDASDFNFTSCNTNLTDYCVNESRSLNSTEGFTNWTEPTSTNVQTTTTTQKTSTTTISTTVKIEEATIQSEKPSSEAFIHASLKRFVEIMRHEKEVHPNLWKRVLDLLVAEMDGDKAAPSYPVRSRTIMLDSGLGWTIPPEKTEEFEEELKRHPISPIFQRVYDSPATFSFWVPIKTRSSTPKLKPLVEINSPVNQSEYTESTISNDTDLEYNLTSVSTAINEPLYSNVINEDEFDSSDVAAITVFTVLSLPRSGNAFKFGVMGLTLEPDYLFVRLQQHPSCSISSNKVCYLLEDGAYIAAVNSEAEQHQIGQFLGHVDPPLMHELLKYRIYQSIKDYNFQATCEPQDEEEALTAGAQAVDFCFKWSVMSIISFFWGHQDDAGYHSFTSSILRSAAIGVLLIKDVRLSTADREPYSCIQAMHLYYANKNTSFDSESSSEYVRKGGVIQCSDECLRDWSIEDIPDTNLKLLVADRKCPSCGKLDRKLPRDPVEDEGPDVCAQALNPRYRRITEKCPAEFEDDGIIRCSGAVLRTSIFAVLSFLLMQTICNE